jgi:uncharacterized protein (DUF362 family)
MTAIVDCRKPEDYRIVVPAMLDKLNLDWAKWDDKTIILKPNLVSTTPFPETTHPELVRVVGEEFKKRCPKCNPVIAESTPAGATEMFVRFGYTAIGYPLMDIDKMRSWYVANTDNEMWPQITLPLILKDAVLVSIALLKEHSVEKYTGAMKNVGIGLPPIEPHTTNGHTKNIFHDKKGVGEAIKAVCAHKPIDLAVVDGTIGHRGFEAGGYPADPPIGKMLIGTDAHSVDTHGCKLMGIDPGTVPHLT